MKTETETLLPEVRRIARAAGAAIMEVYARDFDVEVKDDKSPLTEADLAAHRVIAAGLTALEPALPVLSEESGVPDYAERTQWQSYWLVDPLDGTKEFIKRNGEFTVNIALISDHEPILGVVYAPARELEYYGTSNDGAWKIAADGKPGRISVGAGDGPARIVGSRSHRGASLDAFLENVGDYEMVPMGSSLKFCVVAEGGADIYPRLGPTNEWDTAAAHAVLTAAGGDVVQLDGQSLRYNAKEPLLNPYFLAIGDTCRDWARYVEA
ncbi:MAG: 3'(2'),5'-bisphosphate nucleotidase CysQ [Gammaproteobacteria bacterium]|nr:3'(2'),5'-bisphosphate nucleotidase CysQ [Gammaproteobacteria bacterium]NNF61412.1 3'(2'),5'-bisphosphate nucleotidase CysQ [Gammaproteobacteria bacterium]NNM19813.1 3'(2'),5'-bisphosphate nucleotidase CysQ [Gammaproteobacteria bacterium]